MPRLTWSSHLKAQEEADAAWEWRRPKKRKRQKGKRKRAKRRRAVSYQAYINSPQWKQKRKKALKHYGERCGMCGTGKWLTVHHRHYRTLGREHMKDLRVLCRDCHDSLHEGKVAGVMDSLTAEYLKLEL